jgi:hypothetical protein
MKVIRVGVTSAALLAIGAFPAHAAPSDGYVRLAHLSPDTPAVDVYLYSGKGSMNQKHQKLVLKHVGYGALSPYQRLGGGTYTVAMRPANAAASSKPVLSAVVRVQGGEAYTVAGMGPYKGIKLQVVDDSVALPAGRAAVRVIAASLKEPSVDVGLGGRQLATDQAFGTVSSYRVVPAESGSLKVQGKSGKKTTAKVALSAGTVHTVVVLDGSSGLKVLTLRDSAQGGRTPSGGVNAGYGGLAGTAPRTDGPATSAGSGDRALWTGLGLGLGLVLLTGAGGVVVVRSRRRV